MTESTAKHPRDFHVETFDDYARFWEYHERKQLAADIARALRDGVTVKLNVSPGDATVYNLTLIPTREFVAAAASYFGPCQIEDDTHSQHRVAVFLHNCGEGSVVLNLFHRQEWTDPTVVIEELDDLTDDRSSAKVTRTAIAATLDAIRKADDDARTDQRSY